jgi:hypothetical protein
VNLVPSPHATPEPPVAKGLLPQTTMMVATLPPIHKPDSPTAATKLAVSVHAMHPRSPPTPAW